MPPRRLFLLLAALFCFLNSARAQGTAFTYQGKLNNGGNVANGNYDFAFSVFNASSGGSLLGGPITNLNVGVTNGLFTTLLGNLPASMFNGSNLWLDISVRTNGGSSPFTELTPRQQLTPAPYSIFAGTAGSFTGTLSNSQLANSSVTIGAGPGLSGGGTVALGSATTLTNTGVLAVTGNSDITASTVGGAVVLGDNATSANTANTIVKRDSNGNFSAQNITANSVSGIGSGLTGVNAAMLSGMTTSNFWQAAGNAGTSPTNGNFLGTADNQPLELHVNNQRALRLEPSAAGPNVIGGHAANFVAPGVTSATIAGGGNTGASNVVTSLGGTVGGGFNNSVSNYNGVVSGGANNSASGNASAVGGGSENIALGDHANITGGQGNIIQSSATHGTIVGGYNNTNSGQFATIAGGSGNTATGSYSFAAGSQAQATNQGAFVWADSQGTSFASTSNNQFSVRAGGGVRFVTGGVGMVVDGQTVLSGVIGASQINDGGAGAYQGLENALQSVGGSNSLSFSNLYQMSSTNGVQPSLSLTIGGAAFGTVIGFSGTEGISRPYNYEVEVSNSGAPLNTASELGQPGVLTYTRNGRTTTFTGTVTACTLSGANGSGLLYTVRLESLLATLALGTDHKLYQNLTVAQLVSSVYQAAGGSAPTVSTNTSYPAHASLTQYGETGFNFVSRLMEEEGIFYFFNHSSGSDTLVLADNSSAYLAVPNSPFNYYGNTSSNIPAAAEYIRTFQSAAHQSTLTSVTAAYDFTGPNTYQATNSGSGGVNTNFEFGNSVATQSYENLLAARRQAIQTVQRQTMAGSGSAPDLRAGYVFTLTDQSGAGLGGSYVVTSVHHSGFVLVTNGTSTLFYGNTFQVIPASLAFVPPLVTPRPQAQPCSALVTGPAGETIYTDKYGRVKVQFVWDRYGKNNETSSPWIRVTTPLATGSGRGTLFIPRIGDEMLVSFLEGDPDQPIITGSLYNGGNMPSYSLPGGEAITSIRSTGLGPDSNLYNELEFNDTAGAEQLNLTAAKNMAISANNAINVSAAQTTFNSPASVVGAFSATSLSVNGGTVFTNYQAGQVIVGSCASNMTTVTITFPKAFVGIPKVIATPSSDPNWNNVNDTFVTTVRNVSTTGCTLNVVRVDSTSAWSQNLRANWMAWE